MCFAALQPERQVQLLAKVLNDEIDLIVSHDLPFLLHFATQPCSTHENRAVRDWTAPRINPRRLPMGGSQKSSACQDKPDVASGPLERRF
jgi:hypothetical protein